MQRPLVLLVLALVLGILGATNIKISTAAAMTAAVITFGTAVIGFIRAWRINGWVLFCLYFTLGLLVTANQRSAVSDLPADWLGRQVRLAGTVTDRPDVRPEAVFLKFAASDTPGSPVKAVLRVKIKGSVKVIRYGDRLELTGFINRPSPPGNPGAFDYQAWLNRQGMAAVLTVPDQEAVKILGSGGNRLWRLAYGIRDSLEKIIDQTMNKTNASVVKGLLFGTRGEIPQEVQAAFNQTGLVHILSVSGYHVGVVTVALLVLLRLLKVPGSFTAVIAIPVLLFYAVMTGLAPAVCRSTVMAVLLLLARQVGRQSDWPTSLAAAAGIILLVNPLALYDIGFQLSFVATWGLLYLTPQLNRFCPRLPGTVCSLLTVPLAAQLATWPLVVLYFNLVAPVSLLANVLTAHLVVLIMLFGGTALFLGVILLPLAGFINVATGLLTNLFLWLVQFCHALPGAAWYIPAPPLWAVGVYYLALVGVFELLRQPERQAAVKQLMSRLTAPGSNRQRAVWLALGILLVGIWLMRPVHQGLALHFIDVGQGDSALIITPNKRTVLVDAGGWPEELVSGRGAGNQVVVPYLHRLGINQLDVLVITHPHNDHAGGAGAVIEAMPVKLVLVSPYGQQAADKVDAGYDLLLQQIRRQAIPVQTAMAGQQLKVDPEVDMRFLGPQALYSGTRADANNNSLVLLINYRGRTALLTGDIETEAQRDLFEGGCLSRVEVLKVPHHGSAYGYAAFFNLLQPAAAVISVGANNRFGHPAETTLECLKELNCNIYRTDQQGAVMLNTDGTKWTVKTGK
ncbi:DNA internalization-related competence protein ComEC/Rec2 [Desulfotomaculum varum]